MLEIDLNEIRETYFKSKDEERENIVTEIVMKLIVYSQNNKINLYKLMDDLVSFQGEAVRREDYEVAEAFRLVIKVLNNLLKEIEQIIENGN